MAFKEQQGRDVGIQGLFGLESAVQKWREDEKTATFLPSGVTSDDAQ